MPVRNAFSVPWLFKVDGNLDVADDNFKLTAPYDGFITMVSANLGTVGTSSGNTDFVIEDETDGDLWTVATGVGRIPYGELVLTFYAADLDIDVVEAGQVLTLNVNAIDGGDAAADLYVVLWIIPDWA